MQMHVFLGYPFKLGKSYREQMRAICAKQTLGLRCADEHFTANSIWDNIQDEIDEAFCSIFDLTGYNHNVLLELGYAIGRDRDVIIILHTPPTKSGLFAASPDPLRDFPSDLGSTRRVHYTDMKDLERKLLTAFDSLRQDKHVDEQFWLLLRNFLKDGSQDTKSISTFMESRLRFSYQMTRSRLEQHCSRGDLAKKKSGKVSIYELSRSAL